MKFSSNTRFNLIEKVLKQYNLKLDISKNKNNNIEYVICTNILNKSKSFIDLQLELYDKLADNNFNRLIYYIVESIQINDVYYDNIKTSSIELLEYYNISKNNAIYNITYDSDLELDLINLCVLFMNFMSFKQNKKSDVTDNEIASDSFLFEKTMQFVAEEVYSEKTVSKKLKGIDDIGQSLITDTIIEIDSENKKYLILDAKFYTKSFKRTYDKSTCETNEIDKITYKHQNNRYQMCSYINQLAYNKEICLDSIQGIIVHAVDNELYEKTKELNHRNMNIGHCNIKLELVNIECSADEIIEQIKEIIGRDNK